MFSPSPGCDCLPLPCWCTRCPSQSGHCRYQCFNRWCRSSVLDGSQNNPCTRSSSGSCFSWSHSSRTAGRAVDVSPFPKEAWISQRVCGKKRDPFQAVFERKYGLMFPSSSIISELKKQVWRQLPFLIKSPLSSSSWSSLLEEVVSFSIFNLPVHVEHSLSHT